MAIDSQEREDQERWYDTPVAKATLAIAAVGISLAGVLLVVFFGILAALQDDSSDIDPALGGDEIRDARRVDPASARGPAEAGANSGTTVTQAEPPDTAGADDASSVREIDVTLTSTTDFSRVVRGRTVSAMDSITARQAVYLVAERVELSNGAALRAPTIWIFADEIIGGTLDVSGSDGAIGARDGTDAGSVYVLATRVSGVNIAAVGGTGADGGRGPAGGNGRDGSCRGFGGWRPAQRGGSGGRGEPGGNGGDAGDVRVIFGAIYEPRNISRTAGTGGTGGQGGPGGAGGDGCVGLGGAQSSAGSGSSGPNGADGNDGGSGSETIEERPQLVADILSWLRARPLTVEALRYARSAELDGRAP